MEYNMLLLCLSCLVSVITGFLPINYYFRTLKLNIHANYPDDYPNDDFDHFLGINDESHEPSLLHIFMG